MRGVDVDKREEGDGAEREKSVFARRGKAQWEADRWL
jgi:hypothetical protein